MSSPPSLPPADTEPAAGPTPPSLTGRALRALRGPWRWLVGLLVLAWLGLVLAWLTLHWAILPRLDVWRPEVEQRVGAALGAPVRIGALRVRSGGWVPAFEVDDVRLLDAQGRVALYLGRVSAALSPASLWALEPRFAQLHLDGVRLDVRRDATGRIRVAGLDVEGGSTGGDLAAADWFLQQHEFVIRQGTLRWTDELGSAPPLTLSAVDLVLRNGRRRHELRLDATPPLEWGGRLALRGQFTRGLTSRPTDWARWRGTLYAELPQADVSRLRQHVALPFALDQGQGALRGWFEIDAGQPVQATVDLALNAVSMRLAPDLPPLVLQEVRGRLSAHRNATGLDLAIERLGFTTDDGVPWAPSTLRLSLLRPPGAADLAGWTGGRFSADRLALGPLARLAARLPLPAQVHQGLNDLAPQGEVQSLALEWTGPADAPTRYRLNARASGLSLAAGPPGPPADGLPQTPGRPGISAAELEITAGESGGQARVGVRDGTLDFPGVFEQTEVPVQTLAAQLTWRIEPAKAPGQEPAVIVTLREAQIENADVRGQLSGSWRTGPGSGYGAGGRTPGVIDLQGRILRADPQRVARYLPVGVPASARSYVARAVGPGRVTGGELQIQGDLWRFPFFDGGPGRFRIALQAEDLRYAYMPADPGSAAVWPPFTGVSGRVEIDRASLRIRDARANLDGVALRGVQGSVADLVNRPVLQIEGQGRGPAADLLRFVNGTPVGDWTGGVLQAATVNGAAELQLALHIPLDDPDASTVRGGLQFLGNDLRLQPGTPQLQQARGRLDFTQRGLTITGARARLLGGDASFEGGTQADGSIRITGQGQASAEGLLRAGELPALAPLAAVLATGASSAVVAASPGAVMSAGGATTATSIGSPGVAPGAVLASETTAQPPAATSLSTGPVVTSTSGPGAASRMRGQAAWRAQLGFVQGRTELLVTSPLTGLSLDLPAPLSKPAAATWPLRLQTGGSPARPELQTWSLDLGEVLHLRLERDLSSDLAPVVRSALGLGQDAPPWPERGMAAAVRLPRLDTDAWRSLLAAAGTGPGPQADARAASSSGAPSGVGPDLSSGLSPGLTPGQVALRVGELVAGGRRLSNVAVDLRRLHTVADPAWRAQGQTDQGEGWIEWRPARDATASGRVSAHLSRLDIPASGASEVEAWLERPPAGVPALQLVVDDFHWRGKPLGKLEIEAENRSARPGVRASVQEWQLDRLKLSTPDASLLARGLWSAGQRTSMAFDLSLADGGAFFERMGAGKGMQGGRGRIEGELSWPGSPLAADAGSLRGRFTVALGEGRFLNAEPGAARLFGVLSLQALPRRLLLDFRDVFQQGMAFDTIAGEVNLEGGVARTRNLRVLGVQAAVLIEGSADLRQETQDLRIVAVPELNTATASLAWAALNPAVGLGAFVAQLLLREPMTAATTREFHVTGPWGDPRVERVERSERGAAAPGAAGSAAGGLAGASAPSGPPPVRTP